jgi:hypothetical protein
MSYQRNQIEEAITRIVAPDSNTPPSQLRTRIKRLLELAEPNVIQTITCEHELEAQVQLGPAAPCSRPTGE